MSLGKRYRAHETAPARLKSPRARGNSLAATSEGSWSCMAEGLIESAGAVSEHHLLRNWRSVMFAPVGDCQRRRRGSDGVRLTAAVLALGCCLLLIRFGSRMDRAITEVIHPPPWSIEWLVTATYQADSFGVVLVLVTLALIARRWETARDIAVGAAGAAAVGGILILFLGSRGDRSRRSRGRRHRRRVHPAPVHLLPAAHLGLGRPGLDAKEGEPLRPQHHFFGRGQAGACGAASQCHISQIRPALRRKKSWPRRRGRVPGLDPGSWPGGGSQVIVQCAAARSPSVMMW
jgi:hypothetical protein